MSSISHRSVRYITATHAPYVVVTTHGKLEGIYRAVTGGASACLRERTESAHREVMKGDIRIKMSANCNGCHADFANKIKA